MPSWRPGCLRGSVYEPDSIEYRPASNGYQFESTNDNRGSTLVDLRKKEGCGLGLIIAGGADKGMWPHISNLRPGGIAQRSDMLEVGDTILSVNGIRTLGMKHDEIVNLLKNADDHVRLEIEYDLPECGPTDVFSVRCKQHTISLETDGSSFGFTLRGGMCQNRIKCRPITVTQIRPGGAADREGTLKTGDRILAVNDYSVVNLKLTEMAMLLSECDNMTMFTVEYDVSLIDAVQKATGPLLIELDKTPGAALGITLSHARHKGKHCVCIDSIKSMSVADRCGALHMGDHILSIDGADVEHMTVAEATQLLKSTPGDQIKMEILPVRLVEQKFSKDSMLLSNTFQKMIAPSISSPVLTTAMMGNSVGPSKSYNALGGSGLVSGRLSTEVVNRRHRSWGKPDRRAGSCMSVASASTHSIFTASNQVCRMDTLEMVLYGEPSGLGLVLDAPVFPTTVLGEAPVVTQVEGNSAAERSGVIQEGDRILAINGQELCEKTLDEVNQLLQDSWQRAKIEIEFDIADSVNASSGTFVVKLPRRTGGIGITLSVKTKLGTPMVITEVKKGGLACRCGSVQAGDKLLCISDVRTDNLSIEEATTLLKGDDDIIKLRLQRDDPCAGVNGEECIAYTVELQRHGGPLGVTISGTDDPLDPIVISNLADGGLAARTGAIRVGDRLLAISGLSTIGMTLTEATRMLQTSADLVTLKVARPVKSTPESDRGRKCSMSEPDHSDLCKSTTPMCSTDSALESWDSSGHDTNGNLSKKIPPKTLPKPRPHSTSLLKESRSRNKRPYSSDSTDTGEEFSKKLSELRMSDEAWDADHSQSDNSSPEDQEDWRKVFKTFEAQSDKLRQINDTMQQHSTFSLDRRSMGSFSNGKKRQKVRRNWSHSTSRGAVSQSDLRPYTANTRQRRAASTSGAKDSDNMTPYDELKTIFAPQPIQLHRVTLIKECEFDDFGFGVSDGLHDKGVYISAVRPGSVADKMGLKQYDRILQINKKRTRDLDCSLTIPLISDAGSYLEIVVCRNPLTHNKTPLKDPHSRPLPPDPPEDVFMGSHDRLNQSADAGQIYMNVCSLDTPIARSEKSCKTV